MRLPRLPLLLALLMLTSSPALPAQPAPADFAYGLELSVADHNGLYTLILPQQVYDKVTRADLGDLRVFNTAGQPVPHAVRPLEQPESTSAHPLPFFPLPGSGKTATGDLSLQVRRKGDGTVITVDAVNGPAPRTAPTAYLFDATGLEAKPIELELFWDRNGDTVHTVSLHQSSDLVHWTPLVTRAVVADLRYKDSAVQVRRIALPGKIQPYIRLDCIDCSQPLPITAVTALSGRPEGAELWHWLKLAPLDGRPGKEEGEFAYRMEGSAAITALQLHLPVDNGLVRAIVESRPEEGGDWRFRAQGDFYRLNVQGRAVSSPLVRIPRTTDRDWRIRVVHDDAGLNLNTSPGPLLALGRKQEQLLFLARGAGNYLLAFGARALLNADPPQSAPVLSALRDTRSEALLQWIEPGPVRVLAGDTALKPQLSPAGWKKLLLWAVLVTGVGLLALMTRTLYREMRSKQT